MIKTLIKSIKEYKKQTILTPVFVALEVIMEVLIPTIMAELIDAVQYSGSMNEIYKIGLMLVLSATFALIFGVFSGIFAAKASAGFAKNLRKDLYYNVQNYSFANIDKFSTASLITRLTTDVTYTQQAFQMLIRVAVRAPLMLVFSLIMGFNISISLSCIFLVLIPLIATGLYLIFRKVHPMFEKVIKQYDDLNVVVEENVSAIRVVKSFVNEKKEISKFGKVSDSIYRDFSRAEKLLILSSPLMQFGIYTCILLVSWLGAKQIISTHEVALTVGELSSLIMYGIQLLSSLMMLSMIVVMLTISRASAERIVEVLKEESTITEKENPIEKVKNGSIEFKNVSFSYVDDVNKECLEKINIKINPGEVIGIIGGTGSGKSTLVNLIPRLFDATEGEVLVGGENVKNYDIKSLRNDVAMVLQKNVLFSGTIYDNIRWGNQNATKDEVEEVCKLAVADEFIENFPEKYNTYIEQGGTNVSGGQKQRLCIARALLKKPKILILDDSTSAVDTKTDSQIRKALKEYIPTTTKIIIAQRIASVQDADKIIVMDNGKISAYGTHDQLVKSNKIYKEVYESQVKGVEANAEN